MCQEHAIYQLYFQNSHLINKKFKEFDSFGDFGKKKKTLSIVYYLDRYLSQCLWFGTPFKHPLRHLRQFFLLDSVHFSRNSSSWGFFFLLFLFFFWFWKQINCFEIMCFWKFWETLELLLILSTRSTLSALVFQRTASKSRFFFLDRFFFGSIIFGFFWYSFEFFGYPLSYLVINLVCRCLLQYTHYSSNYTFLK